MNPFDYLYSWTSNISYNFFSSSLPSTDKVETINMHIMRSSLYKFVWYTHRNPTTHNNSCVFLLPWRKTVYACRLLFSCMHYFNHRLRCYVLSLILLYTAFYLFYFQVTHAIYKTSIAQKFIHFAHYVFQDYQFRSAINTFCCGTFYWWFYGSDSY